jgi:hypothetical protein
MSTACLTLTLPVEIEVIWGYLRELMQAIDGTAINPHIGGVRGWTFEGDEVEMADWEDATLRKHNIQGLTFWFPEGHDLFVSWGDMQLQRKWLRFNEVRGEYLMLQKVFGFLLKVVLPRFQGQLPEEVLLSFSYE